MLNLAEIEQNAWNEAKKQASQVLINVARSKGKITYSELVSRISAMKIEAHDSRLGRLLGEISTEENRLGRGLLTVLVVHKTGDLRPGGQFFELAKTLGRPINDKDTFWIAEHKKVCEYWKKNSAEL